jgi:hypothetical protein
MPTAPLSARLEADGSVERVREVDPMISDIRWGAVPVEETETSIDAFVAAVIRTHERVQLNLRRLATERVCLAESETGTDSQSIETFRPGKYR